MFDGQASRTAQGVAARRRAYPRVHAPYGRPDDDQRLQVDVGANEEAPADDPFDFYLRSRTAFVDHAAVDAIADGITQLVLVGAGYDGRSLRYAAPDVRWFELDHPDTQTDKRACLDRLGIDSSAIGFGAADFGVDDVAAVLAAAGHDPTVATAFLSEGVSGYLPDDVLDRLLRTLVEVSPAGSRLAITLRLQPDTEAAVQRHERMRDAVAALGERLSSFIPRSEVAARLASTGWTVVTAVDTRGEPIASSTSNAAFVIAEH